MHSRAGGSLTGGRPAERPRHGIAPRRVLVGAFGLSALINLALIALYALLVGNLRPEVVAFPFAPFAEESGAMVVLRLVEIDEEPEVRVPPSPTEVAVPNLTVRDPRAPVGLGEVASPIGPPPPSGPTRLRPRLGDRRLWAPPDPAWTELSLEQREELLLSGRIVDWYDSVALATAAETAWTDWTFTDSEGKRWGVSEGRVHLGDFSLPLPFTFGAPNGRREELARRAYEWDEILRQGGRVEVEEGWRARAEAIRERLDRERGREGNASPDTVRAGP